MSWQGSWAIKQDYCCQILASWQDTQDLRAILAYLDQDLAFLGHDPDMDFAFLGHDPDMDLAHDPDMDLAFLAHDPCGDLAFLGHDPVTNLAIISHDPTSNFCLYWPWSRYESCPLIILITLNFTLLVIDHIHVSNVAMKIHETLRAFYWFTGAFLNFIMALLITFASYFITMFSKSTFSILLHKAICK